MQLIADLHVHSRFSRATSKSSDLEGLYAWSRAKGIHLVGTGDFTHPAWRSELQQKLLSDDSGLFRLKNEHVPSALPELKTEGIPIRFLLSSEISCIYKKAGKVRKIHVLIFVPNFKSAERISRKLAAIGNLESDGRPILGLDVKFLLEMLLETDPASFMIPAHIWTPWFSLFGSKSGFDSIQDCFEDLSPHIFALETGLSADPEMIRRISGLDRFSLVSNSDCHSPTKLGREATIFDIDINFEGLRNALENPNSNGLVETIEFFPEEGKYYFDGHRRCQVFKDPVEHKNHVDRCPECGKPLTIGVLNRVLQLADRDKPQYKAATSHFKSLIPLPEILSEILRVGPNSKTVSRHYHQLVSIFGSEFNLFLNADIESINRLYSPFLGEAMKRLRNGQVIKQAGYDGEYGQIKLFGEGEIPRGLGKTIELKVD